MELLIVIIVLATAVFLIVFSYLLFKLRIRKEAGDLRKWLVRCFCCRHRVMPPQSGPLFWQYHQLPAVDNACYEHDSSRVQAAQPEELDCDVSILDERGVKQPADQTTATQLLKLNATSMNTGNTNDVSSRPRLTSVDGHASAGAGHNRPAHDALLQTAYKLARVETWPPHRRGRESICDDARPHAAPWVVSCTDECTAAVSLRCGAINARDSRRLSTHAASQHDSSEQRNETLMLNSKSNSNPQNDVTIQINEGCDSNEDEEDADFGHCNDVWQLRAQFESEEQSLPDEENNVEDCEENAATERLLEEARETRLQHYVHAFYAKHNADCVQQAEHSATCDDSMTLLNTTSYVRENSAYESGNRQSCDSLSVSCELSTSFSIPVSFESADLRGSGNLPSPREFVKEVTSQLLVSVRSDQYKAPSRPATSKQSSITSENDTVGSTTIRFSKTGLARRRQFSSKRRHMLPVYETVDYGNGVPQVDNNHHAPFMSLREASIAQPDEITESVSPSVRDTQSQQLTCSSSGSVFNQNYSPSIILPYRSDEDQLVCVDSKTQAIVSDFLRSDIGYFDEAAQHYRVREKRTNAFSLSKHIRTQSENITERQTLLQPCRRYHAKVLLGGASTSRRAGRLQQMFRVQYHRSADSATGATAAEDCNETATSSSGNPNARMFIRHQMHSFESNQSDVNDVLSASPAVPCYSVPAICATATTGSISASAFSDNSNYYSESGHGGALSESMNSSRSTSFRDIPVIRLTTDTEDTAQL